VIVREDVAVGRHDEARAACLFRLVARRLIVELTEKILDAWRKLLTAAPTPLLSRWACLREFLDLNGDNGWTRMVSDCLERRLRFRSRSNLCRRRLGRRGDALLRPPKVREIEARSEHKAAQERGHDRGTESRTIKTIRHGRTLPIEDG